MFQMTKTNPFITHFSPNVTNSILYSSGHADMLVLPCSACCSFLFFLGESLPMKVRSESGEGLCFFFFFFFFKKKKGVPNPRRDTPHRRRERDRTRERKKEHPSISSSPLPHPFSFFFFFFLLHPSPPTHSSHTDSLRSTAPPLVSRRILLKSWSVLR